MIFCVLWALANVNEEVAESRYGSSSSEDDSEDEEEEEGYAVLGRLREGGKPFSYVVSSDVLDLQLPASKPDSPYVFSSAEGLPPLPLSPVFNLPLSTQVRPPVSDQTSSNYQSPDLPETLPAHPPSARGSPKVLPVEAAVPVSGP
jgi:hypothetical protein